MAIFKKGKKLFLKKSGLNFPGETFRVLKEKEERRIK
jgi:hypothetical protein